MSQSVSFSLIDVLRVQELGSQQNEKALANSATKVLKKGKEQDKVLAKAEEVAQEFETLFVELMIKNMRATAKPEDMSNALDIYTSMLDTEYAKAITSAQNLGIRDLILDWLKVNDPHFLLQSRKAEGLKAYAQQSRLEP